MAGVHWVSIRVCAGPDLRYCWLQADVSGLTKCSESKQFAKRQKNELKALDKRLKLVIRGCRFTIVHLRRS